MTFGDSIKVGFKNATKFRGVASRSEYWWFFLFTMLVAIGASLIDTAFGLDEVLGGLISTITTIALILPRFTLLIRRFRDTGVSPLWIISALIPLSGLVSWVVNNFASLQSVVEKAMGLSDEGLVALAQQLAQDPAFVTSLSQLLAILGLVLAYSIFELVVTLLPSKPAKQTPVAPIVY